MELIRLGDKIISRGKIDQTVNKIINLRIKVFPRQRLPTIGCRPDPGLPPGKPGEIRKGRSLGGCGVSRS